MVAAWPAMGTVLQVSAWDADTALALAAMEAARVAAFRTDSAFSPDIAAWSAGRDTAALSVGAVQLLDFARSVAQWLRCPLEPDLERMAKGLALDRALNALRAGGVRSAVGDLGGTFAMLGLPPVGPSWSMALENPFHPGEVFAALQLDTGAVTTVSDDADPRISRPGRAAVSVSVIAPGAFISAALARALFTAGPEAGCRLAARLRVDALWVRDPGSTSIREADEGVDPRLLVITDALADRLELISEAPAETQPTRCSQLVRGQ
jgi:hypothetical protein